MIPALLWAVNMLLFFCMVIHPATPFALQVAFFVGAAACAYRCSQWVFR